MKCPHCDKPIERKFSPELKARIKEMVSSGIPHRRVALTLRAEGYSIAHSTVWSIAKEKKRVRSRFTIATGIEISHEKAN